MLERVLKAYGFKDGVLRLPLSTVIVEKTGKDEVVVQSCVRIKTPFTYEESIRRLNAPEKDLELIGSFIKNVLRDEFELRMASSVDMLLYCTSEDE